MSNDPRTAESKRAGDTGNAFPSDAGLLETLLANAPDFVYFKDHERRFVCISRPFEALLGRTESEILGKRDEDLFPPEVAMQTVADDRRVIEDGISIVNKLEGSEVPDGGKVWVLTTKIPWRDSDGNVLGLFGISRNISDRIAAEEALRAETAFTNAALDAQLDTFFVFEPGTRRAVRWNRAFREVSGYSDEQIAILPAPDSYYSAEDLERADSFISKVVKHGFGTIELQLICKDGSEIPMEYRVSILDDHNGGPRYIISIGRDISERRRADQALRVQRERLVRFMNSATDSFHLLDPDLRLIEINETALARIREVDSRVRGRKDVIGRSLLDLYPFLRGGSEEARYKEVLRTKQPLTYDSSAEHRLRGTVHMTIRLFMVGDDLGLIATDISDRKQAEENRLDLERQVQHSQKLESLGVLAGGIAHDFNNILVSILGYADLASREMPASAAGREHVEEIIVGARRAQDLATQMLAYSGKGRFELQLIDLNEFVKEMAHLLKVSTSRKSQLVYDFDEDLPAIEGDITQVRQVIMNLITNASEAIGDNGGVIKIATGMTHADSVCFPDGKSAKPGSKYVYLEVSDTGCGMDGATREKMFEPFFTTKFAGRGLGMAAVQGIVRGHGGSIEVRSQVNGGTIVKVLFPVAINRTGATSSQGALVKEEKPWHGSGTVLVVDDEASVRGLAKKMIGLMGFDVIEAADGRQAIEIFRSNHEVIKAVVLDLTMPQMDGEECFRALRQLNGDVPVVLSSGYSEQEITGRFAGLDINGFIQKPYTVATMRSTIRAAVED